MEKAAQNILHLLSFKKVSGGISNAEKNKITSNVLGREIFVLSHFDSKHSLIYEMSAFFLLSTFVIFAPFSQCFRMCGSILTLLYFSFLSFKVKDNMKIEWWNK